MSYSVDIVRGATVYNVSDGNPFWALSLTGLGLPPTRLIKERGPQQHGSTVVGFQLDERMLNLGLLIQAGSEALADQYRDDLAEILKPVAGVPCIIRVTRSDGVVRQIDGYTVGVVDFPNSESQRLPGHQLVVAQFEAPDPIPYDPALQNIVFTVASGEAGPGGYGIPLLVPVEYTSGSFIDAVESLTYNGKWDVFPKVFLTGPMVNPVITNETTNTVLDFTGTTIAGGDIWEIDLRYGFKTVRDSNGDLQNAALTDDSDLVTWGLAASPVAVGGINDIRVTVPSGATASTKVRVEFYNRYPNLG